MCHSWKPEALIKTDTQLFLTAQTVFKVKISPWWFSIQTFGVLLKIDSSYSILGYQYACDFGVFVQPNILTEHFLFVCFETEGLDKLRRSFGGPKWTPPFTRYASSKVIVLWSSQSIFQIKTKINVFFKFLIGVYINFLTISHASGSIKAN